jgi:hypothetical protein
MQGQAVVSWMVLDGMTNHFHEFNPHEGGTFRISLTHDAPRGHLKNDG